MPDDIPKLRTPEYPETHARKFLPPKAKVALVKKQLGRCAKCYQKPRVFEYDHVVELWAGGSNDPDNWQALCRKCHTDKSGAEAKHRAKMNRLRGLAGQVKRRKERGPTFKSKRPIPSRALRSQQGFGKRGFDKSLRRKFNGTVERIS